MKTVITLLTFFLVNNITAQQLQDSSDTFIVQLLKSSGTRLETERAIFWFEKPPDAVQGKTFINDVTEGINAIEVFTGIQFDTAWYGTAKIEYFITDYTTVSHVYNGYQHNAGERLPYIFFSAARVQKNAAPFLHETTHLILRSFYSLWIREGMAEWVAMEVAKNLGKGHTAFYSKDASEDAHSLAAGIEHHERKDLIFSFIGTNGIPRFRNTEIRRMFYIGSTSFVQYLSYFLTKENLLKIYFAEDTALELEQTTNTKADKLKEDWIRWILSKEAKLYP